MDEDWVYRDVVDPEVRAHIYSLVSALGGTGNDENGQYILGDDALGCLRDLKRWLKLYDEKIDRLDVARCLAEANLVNGDLLPILASWPEGAIEDRIRSKIALSCLEILVPLTWPIEKSEHDMTVNHHRHYPYLHQSQLFYKRGILNRETASFLKIATRIALPSIAQPIGERSSRDEGIIRLLLYLLRNVVIISPAAGDEDGDTETSRSNTIDGFHYQQIFQLLLTISSGMGEDFNTQDVIVLELLFHLLKGLNIHELFMKPTAFETRHADELRRLMAKEKAMLSGYARNAPSRHNRFGTMIWIKRDDERVSTVSGQANLLDGEKSLAKMDTTKKWKKPQQKSKLSQGPKDEFDLPVPLTTSAIRHLRSFTAEFLDTSFNPLFTHLRKAIEREADRVSPHHSRQFFYLIAWFLEAERVRRKAALPKDHSPEPDSYSVIASVLNQETFILLNRYMQECYDNKEWTDLNAGMRCFTQILLTVQEMSESPLEEDQVIAENIQNRIFYEETTHDRIVAIIRQYSNQGLGYLNACTELAHVHLRMLERYSKQNADLQIRSRRRARRKKSAEQAGGNDKPMGEDGENEGDSEAEDLADAKRTAVERKFDFTRFATKFMSQACVDTFVELAKYYHELEPDQLKRCHRFFYRVAFKMEMSVMLFRVDIIALFHRMVQGDERLNPASAEFTEWDQLIRQLFRKLVRKLEERPQLVVEMLFSKINSTVHFLEFGFEKQTAKVLKGPAELEVKPGFSYADEIGIIVAVLLKQDRKDAVEWVLKSLSDGAVERQAWGSRNTAVHLMESVDGGDQAVPAQEVKPPSIVVRPDNETRRVAMHRDAKLRLLMTMVGFLRFGIDEEVDVPWIIPSSLSTTKLLEALEAMRKALIQLPTFENGMEADDFIRRKPKPKVAYDDESDDGIDDDEDPFMFPEGGPSASRSDALEQLKEHTRKRRYRELDEQDLQMREEARRLANAERQRQIKSALYVHDSDDEDDQERDALFFQKEEALRKLQGKRASIMLSDDPARKIVDRDSAGEAHSSDTGQKKRKRVGNGRDESSRDPKRLISLSDSEEELQDRSSPDSLILPVQSETDEEETPVSSPAILPLDTPESQKGSGSTALTAAQSPMTKAADGGVDVDEDEEEAEPVAEVARKRRRRALFVESDSE